MHLLTNEQGEPVPHGHHHDHPHEHSHEHLQEHQHDHHHEHQSGELPTDTAQKLTAVLDYMLRHNQAHAAELLTIAEKLTDTGNGEAAGQVQKAVDAFSEGNRLLGLALERMKGA